ncbi:hypothetical protein OLX02_10850 [Novosphingobium sp. KCTC 2891]|uniref:hypothetical protein n=1 Tax=Novosphingobium sp. KCTC 2891 TaxID=2989730 RepID=UPI002223821C|nr:hypothetical protein [Novosphingobium sp. KCTC 2891]MCW1383322.1 hypothetical protein [Novosphingobium sp. KCTC 2891]
MRTPALIAAAFALIATSPPAPSATPDLSRLTTEHRADLRCAATLAIGASEQQRGSESALAFPPLAVRGKRYFADVGARVGAEAGLSREQVRDLLTADVAELQHTAGSDPDAALAAAIKPCLARLDRAVPPLKTPDLLRCTAILSIAFDELHAREGLTPAAQDLKTLASVLSAREHEALVAAGKSGDEADATIALAHDAMLKEAFDGEGGVEKYEIGHCYDLAKPDTKSHY